MAAVFRAWPLSAGGWPDQPPDSAEPTDPPAESTDDPEPIPEGYEPI